MNMTMYGRDENGLYSDNSIEVDMNNLELFTESSEEFNVYIKHIYMRILHNAITTLVR